MRVLVAAFALALVASTAWAQGYAVEETSGRLIERPADARSLEDASAPFMLPFAFPFFGEPTTSVLVSADGFVQPGVTETARATEATFPLKGAADGVVAPWWTAAPDGVRVETWTVGAAPQRTLVIAWTHGVQRKVQLHLHEGSGEIAFAYSFAPVSGKAPSVAALCGLDERRGRRFVTPIEGGRVGTPPADFVFTPRTVLLNPEGIRQKGAVVRWQDVRKESTIPDGCTKRCTYLARGRGYLHVADRSSFFVDDKGAQRKRPADAMKRLVEEDRETFGGKGDAGRWVRQVLDGKMIFMPADGGAPLRVWFRIVEYFSLDSTGTTGADQHVWNLRWMLSNAFPGKDEREQVDGYYAWKAMASARLTVGKLYRTTQTDDAGKQYDSGRNREYLLWSGRLKHGTRGVLAPYATPGDGWTRFFLKEDDANLVQHGEKEDVRFVPDPHYVDGHYGYVIQTGDNPFGWVTGRTIPPPPVRDEGIEVDPGRKTAPETPK